MAAGRRHSEAQEEVSPSADGDKGYAPLTAPPFEKGGRKLSADVIFN
jgi:hypothetical protein